MNSQKIRIKLKAYDHRLLDHSVKQILEQARGTGAVVSGPIPLPTDKTIYTVQRSTNIDKKSREQFEIRTFRRNMIITPSAQTIDALMKVELAPGVEVEIKVAKGGQI